MWNRAIHANTPDGFGDIRRVHTEGFGQIKTEGEEEATSQSGNGSHYGRSETAASVAALANKP